MREFSYLTGENRAATDHLMADGEVQEEKGHVYRIIELLVPSKKGGRPKKVVIQSFVDLSTQELNVFRKKLEPQLRPNQIAELDGRPVARGSNISPNVENEAELVHQDESQAAATFSYNLVWDGYLRSVDAAAELQAQLLKANEDILAQHKKIKDEAAAMTGRFSEMIDELVKFKISMLRSGPAETKLDVDSLAKLAGAVAEAVHDAKKKG